MTDMANFILLIFAIFSISASSESSLLGGIEDVDKNDPDVLDSLDFAINSLNRMSNNMYRYMSAEVTDATKQVRCFSSDLGCYISQIVVI